MMYFIFELDRSVSKKTDRNAAKRKVCRTVNEMINSNDRRHFRATANLVTHLRTLSRTQAMSKAPSSGYEPFSKDKPCHIGIRICPPTKRRMDAPNWYPTVKALIDGLTDAGVFTDDNNNVITSMTFFPGNISGTKKYRIEIMIKEGADTAWQI